MLPATSPLPHDLPIVPVGGPERRRWLPLTFRNTDLAQLKTRIRELLGERQKNVPNSNIPV